MRGDPRATIHYVHLASNLAHPHFLTGILPRCRVAASLPVDFLAVEPKLAADIRTLSDKDKAYRFIAALDLANMGSDGVQAVPALISAVTRDEDNQVRSMAATALGHIGPSSSSLDWQRSGAGPRFRRRTKDDSVSNSMAR
jgi:HEAT repeat protein